MREKHTVYMNPLARWTFGCCNSNGEEALRLSVRSFKRLHPEFDQIVCYNHVSPTQIEMLKRLDVPLLHQMEADCPCKLVDISKGFGKDWSMPGWGWKLCPLRLRPEAKELWVDNDIIFRERLPSLSSWLETQNTAIISTAHKRAYGSNLEVPDADPVCAGFFGVPETSEFEEKAVLAISKYGGREIGYWDEQEIVAFAVLSMAHTIIPMSELTIVKELTQLSPAMHFIGLNRTKQHDSWNHYKCCTTLM